jgi:hypothetical protein
MRVTGRGSLVTLDELHPGMATFALDLRR